MTRYVLDRSTRRLGGRPTIIGGSPLRLFRLSTAGLAAFQRIAAGADEPPSVLTERLVDAGAIHPQPRFAPYGLTDVTVVVPALRPHPAALAAIADGCAGTAELLVVDDGSDPPIPSTPG
nr:mycofactocin system glycosyltransferase [Acidimicrobiia bacterium]